MKVYICGAHSCGKTTLARYVSEKYKLPMITEVARAVLSEKELHLDSLRYDLNLVDDYQHNIFQRQLQEEMKNTDFVSDRSFDCLAYAAQHARILNSLINGPDIHQYIDKFTSKVRPELDTSKDIS